MNLIDLSNSLIVSIKRELKKLKKTTVYSLVNDVNTNKQKIQTLEEKNETLEQELQDLKTSFENHKHDYQDDNGTNTTTKTIEGVK